jgi:hypothetical protein
MIGRRARLHIRTAVATHTAVALLLAVALVGVAILVLSGALGGTAGDTQPGQHSSTTQSQTTGTHSTLSTPTGPLTNIQVSGAVTTSGQGTMPTKIAFVGAPGTFNATISGGHYNVTLPGPATYGVYIQWTGTFSFQSGTVYNQLFNLELPKGSNSTTYDIGAPTPNSVVQVSGRVNTTGIKTNAATATFANSYGQQYTAQVRSGSFSIGLPNLANYTAQVKWNGAYAWQSGDVPVNSIVVSAPAGVANTTADLQASTPDSVITMTGSATSSGSGTTVTGVTYTTEGLSFPANLSGSHYTVQLPNLASFTTSVSWAGSYSWQGGSISTSVVSVSLSPGQTSTSQDLSASTPNSVVTISGSISLASGLSPTLITFAVNGQQFTATPNGSTYTIQLPNLTNYLVSINWMGGGQTGTCHSTPDTYPLSLGPGVAVSSGVNWAC